MKGSDLRCPTCKGMAVDVDPDLNLDPSFRVNMCSTMWTCVNGHRNMIDVAQTDEGEVYVAAEATLPQVKP